MEASSRRFPRLRVAAAISAMALVAAACGGTSNAATGGGRTVKVVAGENFWGSIVKQLGGSHVKVLSIVSDPNADPHDYESSASDARAIDVADYVVQNGVGYDEWLNKLLSASQQSKRHVYNIGQSLGKKDGDNPHLWYNPDYVTAVENHVEADLKAIDPADASYFTEQRAKTDTAFAPMRSRLATLKQTYAGTPVASTESIFAYTAQYLGLDLISPPAFMDAVAEGNDPPAASVATFEQQVSSGTPKTLVYNAQTSTSLTTTVRTMAAQHKIPVVAVTETIQPPNVPFETWMDGQLASLQNALHSSVGK